MCVRACVCFQVGEKGLTLSGGQKQRLALARAAYCGLAPELPPRDAGDSDNEAAVDAAGNPKPTGQLFLLDDPLSALDASTGRHIFRHLLGPRGLMRRSTRVLVTHALEVLPSATTVVVLHQGAMAFAGSFTELQRVTAEHVTLSVRDSPSGGLAVAAAGGDAENETKGAAGGDDIRDQTQTVSQVMAMLSHAVGEAGDANAATSTRGGRSRAHSSFGNRSAVSESFEEYDEHDASGSVSRVPRSDGDGRGTLIEAERSVVGAVSMDVFKKYFKAAGGVWAALLLLLAFIVERVAFVGTDWWLSSWMSASQPTFDPIFGMPRLNVTDTLAEQQDVRYFYATGYATLCASNVVAVIIRTSLFAYLGVRASQQLFRTMLHSITAAPMSFFDTTPLGRILSRLAFDTDTIDFILITRLSGAVASYWWVGCALVIVTAVVPLVVVMLVPVMIIYYIIQKRYRHSSRALQRLDNVSRSPLQSVLSESLNGASTIRAFQAIDRFVEVYDSVIDANTQAVFAYQSSTRWLGVRVETLGALVTAAAGVACFLARDTLSGGFAGLAVTWVRGVVVYGRWPVPSCSSLLHVLSRHPTSPSRLTSCA